MAEKIVGVILALVVTGAFLFFWWSLLDFILEMPKQLKRIADALEKDGDNDG